MPEPQAQPDRRLPARWLIAVRPEPGDDVPPAVRLRSALKTLLRTHKLRCVDVTELQPPTENEP